MLCLILHYFFSMSLHRNLLLLHLTGEATELGRRGGKPVPSQGPDLPLCFLSRLSALGPFSSSFVLFADWRPYSGKSLMKGKAQHPIPH